MGRVGILAVITSFIGLSYYSVLGGWVIVIFFHQRPMLLKMGQLFFADFTADTGSQIFYYVIFMILTVFIVARGVQKGIEKACKVMMPLLLVCIIVVAIRSCTLPGAGAGIEFFLKPDFSKLTPGAFLGALGQVFFSCLWVRELPLLTALTWGRTRRSPTAPAVLPAAIPWWQCWRICHTAGSFCLWI